MGLRCFYLPTGAPHVVSCVQGGPATPEIGLHNIPFSTKLVLAFFSGGFYNGVTRWGEVVCCGAITHENGSNIGEVTR